MLFNSINFALFLPIVFFPFIGMQQKGTSDFKTYCSLFPAIFSMPAGITDFLVLLIFSTSLDYFTGIKIFEASGSPAKKVWLCISICINVGFLGLFKYYNFFAASCVDGLSLIGIKSDFVVIHVLLPLGISFYTFHGLSYIFDIYKNRIQPERNLIDYSLFVSFFPLLIAGPIERATHLLPQILKKRAFNYSTTIDGLRQILWGLFKKIVIADNCAEYANMIFNNSAYHSGSTLFLGALFFSFQIYCDFSGYSDIAIGTARLFGIELLRNFAFPYFSRDIAEFWRRWHISLSSWFRDYLYIPLGGSRGGMWMKIRNTFIIFIVSGFWHGANWTFIVWGLVNALYIMPSVIFKTNRTNLDIVAKGKYFPTIKELLSMSITFCLTVLAWIFFRANNLSHAFSYISGIFSSSLFTSPYLPETSAQTLLLTGAFFVIEWLGREQHYAIAHLGLTLYRPVRWTMYYSIILTVLYFAGNKQPFIYFQF